MLETKLSPRVQAAAQKVDGREPAAVATMEAVPVQRQSPQQGLSVALKRFFDVIVSAAGLVAVSPVLILVAVLIRLTMGKPVFFRQQRPGKNARPFMVLKFRTMADDRDADGRLLEDRLRLTRVGALLRRLSLDELPQLLNVLRGELSLVGPRPLLMKYLDLYSARQARRHEVMPGITGWAQVCGRNQLSWKQKLELDVWYVENWSFWLDLKILFLTVSSVIRADGINRDGAATMPEFTGRCEEDI